MQFLSREFLYVTISKPLSNFHLLGSFLEHSRDMMVIMCSVRSLFEYRLNIFLVGWVQGATLSLRHKLWAQSGPLFFWHFCKRAITVVTLVQCFGDCGLCQGTKICPTFVLFLRLCRLLTGLDPC